MISESEFIYDIESKYRTYISQAVNRLRKEKEETENLLNSKPSLNLGKEIKDLRQEANLTQEEFSYRCQVGLRFIRELEQGKSTIQLDKLLKVLEFFGRSLTIIKYSQTLIFNKERIYSKAFTKELKLKIKHKYHSTCVICRKTQTSKKEKFDIHHIDYDKQNCIESNLIFLCGSCHGKTNKNKDFWIKYFSNLTII